MFTFTSLVLYQKYTCFQGSETCLMFFNHIRAFQHIRFTLYSSTNSRHNLPWLSSEMQMYSACAGCWWIFNTNGLYRNISLLLLRDSEVYCIQSLFWDLISHLPAPVCRALNKRLRRLTWLQTSNSAEKPGERFK